MDASSLLPSVRSWRTAVLTLRDEVLSSSDGDGMTYLLHHLIFSQSEILIAAAPELPGHEVTSDVMFLVELTRTILDSGRLYEDVLHTFSEFSCLMHNFIHVVSFEMNSSSGSLVVGYFGSVAMFLSSRSRRNFSGNAPEVEATKQCLHTVRCLLDMCQTTIWISEGTQLLENLVKIVSWSQAALASPSSSGGKWRSPGEDETMALGCSSFWEIQATAFNMISEIYSRAGDSLSADHWKLTIEDRSIGRTIGACHVYKGLCHLPAPVFPIACIRVDPPEL